MRLQPGMPLSALVGGQTRATSSAVGELGGSQPLNVWPPSEVLKSLRGPPQVSPTSPTVRISAMSSVLLVPSLISPQRLLFLAAKGAPPKFTPERAVCP